MHLVNEGRRETVMERQKKDCYDTPELEIIIFEQKEVICDSNDGEWDTN